MAAPKKGRRPAGKAGGNGKVATPAASLAYSGSLSDLVPDGANANRGTDRGRALLEKSVRALGAGRSLLVDRNGKVIAGNKTREAAMGAGMDDAIVVETDGTRLVVVKRTDLDLDEGGEARELAYADNKIAQVDLSWDADQVRADALAGLDLADLFGEKELEQLLEASRVTSADFDPQAEWAGAGMPEYDHEDKTAVRQIVVNFKSNADALAFGALLGQPVSPKTRSVWYPAVPNETLMDKRYAPEATEDEEAA